MMRFRLSARAFTGLLALWLSMGLANCAMAQEHPAGEAAPTGERAAPRPRVVRPPVFIDENWKQPTVPVSPTDHAWPAQTDDVASGNLTLQFYGMDAAKKLLLSGNHQTDTNPLNWWNGICDSPVAVTLKDKDNYVDLTGLAKIQWVTRTSGFHAVRPVVKLADGTYLVGDVATSEPDFNVSEVSFAGIHWIKLNIDKVVTTGNYVENPDLSKVDEVGYADLMPGSGHGNGGWVNVGHFIVYGKPVKR